MKTVVVKPPIGIARAQAVNEDPLVQQLLEMTPAQLDEWLLSVVDINHVRVALKSCFLLAMAAYNKA